MTFFVFFIVCILILSVCHLQLFSRVEASSSQRTGPLARYRIINIFIILLSLLGLSLIFVFSDGVNRTLLTGTWLLTTFLLRYLCYQTTVNVRLMMVINVAISLLLFIPNNDVDGVVLTVPSLGIDTKYDLEDSTSKLYTELGQSSKGYLRHSGSQQTVTLEMTNQILFDYRLIFRPLATTNIQLSSIKYYEKVGFMAAEKIKTDAKGIVIKDITPFYQSNVSIKDDSLLISSVERDKPLWLVIEAANHGAVRTEFNIKQYLKNSLLSLITWQLLFLLCFFVLPRCSNRGKVHA